MWKNVNLEREYYRSKRLEFIGSRKAIGTPPFSTELCNLIGIRAIFLLWLTLKAFSYLPWQYCSRRLSNTFLPSFLVILLLLRMKRILFCHVFPLLLPRKWMIISCDYSLLLSWRRWSLVCIREIPLALMDFLLNYFRNYGTLLIRIFFRCLRNHILEKQCSRHWILHSLFLF